jgi:hypothetical protein
MSRRFHLRQARAAAAVALVLALAAALTAGGAHGVWAQAKKPISKNGLMNSVRINGLTTVELVRQIERRGVDFEMTAADEADLRSVGARPEVIAAARANYRGAAAPAVASRPANTRPANTTPANASVPAGPPLSQSEVVTMLQGGISPARVEQFVEARGVSFAVTPEVAAEIKRAGGNNALIGAITVKATEVASNRPNNGGANNGASPFNPVGADDSDRYDDLIDSANSAVSANDWRGTVNYLQQAIRLDPSQPTAYSLLGTVMLYANRDVASAERSMRAAIERGGAAAFKVYHDHDGAFGNYCEGSFFVTKTGVSFKANDGQDTFETEDTNIKEAKTNAFVGAQYGAFHIKPVQRINGRDNFNFAPATQQKAEAQLLLRLIKEY